MGVVITEIVVTGSCRCWRHLTGIFVSEGFRALLCLGVHAWAIMALLRVWTKQDIFRGRLGDEVTVAPKSHPGQLVGQWWEESKTYWVHPWLRGLHLSILSAGWGNFCIKGSYKEFDHKGWKRNENNFGVTVWVPPENFLALSAIRIGCISFTPFRRMDRGYRLLIDKSRHLCILAWPGGKNCHDPPAKYELLANMSVDKSAAKVSSVPGLGTYDMERSLERPKNWMAQTDLLITTWKAALMYLILLLYFGRSIKDEWVLESCIILALSHTLDVVPSDRAAVLSNRYFEWWSSLYPKC